MRHYYGGVSFLKNGSIIADPKSQCRGVHEALHVASACGSIALDFRHDPLRIDAMPEKGFRRR